MPTESHSLVELSQMIIAKLDEIMERLQEMLDKLDAMHHNDDDDDDDVFSDDDD